jgi:hypothetical protein
MRARNKVARILAILGSIVLLASAGLHFIAAHAIAFPAVSASNLAPPVQSALKIAFLDMAWHWIVIAVVVLVAVFGAASTRKVFVLICGFAMLAETGLTLVFVGLFIGNEMIGSAAILLICGGLLLDARSVETKSEAI